MIAGAVSAAVTLVAGLIVGLLVGGAIGAVIGGAIGLALGVFFGWTLARAHCYERSPKGVFLFVVDHTWSLLNTVAGSMFLLVSLAKGNELNVVDSRHTGKVVFTRGLIPNRKRIVGPDRHVVRTYFATTVGNVMVGVHPDGSPGLKRHEGVHVFQARLFGPFYLPLVAIGFAVAIVLPYWLLYHDRERRPIRSVRDYFMRGVYPHVWHEEWAYSVGGTPP
jgi:hypothetical protein